MGARFGEQILWRIQDSAASQDLVLILVLGCPPCALLSTHSFHLGAYCGGSQLMLHPERERGGTTKKPKYIFLCYWTRKTNSKWSAFRTFTDAPSHWQPNNGLISAYWEQILQGHFTPHLWKQFSVPFSSTSSSFGLQKFYSDLLLPLSSPFCSCRYEDSGVEEGAAFRLLLVLLSVGSYEGSALGFLQTLLLPHARSLGCPLQQAWPFKQVNSYSLVASGVRRCEQKCLPCHCLVGKVLAS